VRKAATAAGLTAVFDPLNLGADVGERCLALALEWFKREGADTVADLCELPAGACKKFVDSLGLPPLKAQRLPKALEGASLTNLRRGTTGLRCAATCGGRCGGGEEGRGGGCQGGTYPRGRGEETKGACVGAGVWEWACFGLSGSVCGCGCGCVRAGVCVCARVCVCVRL